MTGLQIQPAGAAHNEVLAHLHRQCFHQEWRASAFAELLNSPGCFALLAVVNDRPAGFALARVAIGEGEILSLGVLPRQREKGVGRFLLAGLTAYVARNGGVHLFLEVSENNHPARMLYGSAGFHDVGKRRNYYIGQNGKPETAIIMRRELAG